MTTRHDDAPIYTPAYTKKRRARAETYRRKKAQRRKRAAREGRPLYR